MRVMQDERLVHYDRIGELLSIRTD